MAGQELMTGRLRAGAPVEASKLAKTVDEKTECFSFVG